MRDNRPAPKPRRLSWLAWVLIVIAFGAGTVFGLGLADVTATGTGAVADNAVADAVPTTSPTTSDTPTTTTTPATTAAPDTPSYGDGTYVVGEDIQPGIYHTAGRDSSKAASCYWERLSGLSGELGDIIAFQRVSGPTMVEIAPSDVAFHTRGCKPWTPK